MPSTRRNPARGSRPESAGGLQEVIVTANRRHGETCRTCRSRSRRLTGETLTQLNATTFDDYAKFSAKRDGSHQRPRSGPDLHDAALRPPRTVSSRPAPPAASRTSRSISMSSPRSCRAVTWIIYAQATIIERIEVLEGPAGHTVSAARCAGRRDSLHHEQAPRSMSPKRTSTRAMRTTVHGKDKHQFSTAMLNLPLIEDKLAVRGVVYNDSRGGYIDNVAGSFTRNHPPTVGIAYLFCPQTGGERQAASDMRHTIRVCPGRQRPGLVVFSGRGAHRARPSYNDKHRRPVNQPRSSTRACASQRCTTLPSSGTFLVSQSYQDIRADGVFAEMPFGPSGETLPDLSVVQFNPSTNDDRFSNTAWTLDGRINQLQGRVYGRHLVRNVEQFRTTRTTHAGKYADYYQCRLPGTPFAGYNSAVGGYQKVNPADPGECFSPSSTFHVLERNTHQNHELRLSTPDDWRLRAIGGLFYEDFLVQGPVRLVVQGRRPTESMAPASTRCRRPPLPRLTTTTCAPTAWRSTTTCSVASSRKRPSPR